MSIRQSRKKDPEEWYLRVQCVELAQSLVREPARRGGLFAENIIFDDRFGVVLATRTGWRDCQKFGQLSQHHGAARVGAAITKPETRAHARLCLIGNCPRRTLLHTATIV